jgi:hypothetical protein
VDNISKNCDSAAVHSLLQHSYLIYDSQEIASFDNTWVAK